MLYGCLRLIFSLSHFMSINTLYMPYCNRILQDENHRLSPLLLSTLHQYCLVTLSEFQLPHLLLLYESLSALCLIPWFQLSCRHTAVTSESCLFCSCFLSTTSHFCTNYQCSYPPCFQNSLPDYQFNAFSLFSLTLSTLSSTPDAALCPKAYLCAPLIYPLMHFF